LKHAVREKVDIHFVMRRFGSASHDIAGLYEGQSKN
jgi:hypothetical protein